MNETLTYYNQNADAFVEGTQNADMSEQYRHFSKYLSLGGKLLDLGCGTGTLTELMYDIPSDPSIERVTITAECVRDGAAPEIIRDPEKAERRVKIKTGSKGKKKAPASAS